MRWSFVHRRSQNKKSQKTKYGVLLQFHFTRVTQQKERGYLNDQSCRTKGGPYDFTQSCFCIYSKLSLESGLQILSLPNLSPALDWLDPGLYAHFCISLRYKCIRFVQKKKRQKRKTCQKGQLNNPNPEEFKLKRLITDSDQTKNCLSPTLTLCKVKDDQHWVKQLAPAERFKPASNPWRISWRARERKPFFMFSRGHFCEETWRSLYIRAACYPVSQREMWFLMTFLISILMLGLWSRWSRSSQPEWRTKLILGHNLWVISVYQNNNRSKHGTSTFFYLQDPNI